MIELFCPKDTETSLDKMELHGDLTDATNLIRIIQEVQPDEIYNLAAQSHVKVSFETARSVREFVEAAFREIDGGLFAG